MTKERVFHPPIKEHLDKIGNVAITDALGGAMERFADNNGEHYSHETYVGSKYMHEIAECYASVYRSFEDDDDVDPNDVWQSTRVMLATRVQSRHDELEEHLAINPNTEKHHGLVEKSLREDVRVALRTSILMYAFDRHDGRTSGREGDIIDKLLDSHDLLIRDEVELARREFTETGLVVLSPDRTKEMPIADIISNRPKERENYSFDQILQQLKDPNRRNLHESIGRVLQTIRYAEYITTEQYDELLGCSLDTAVRDGEPLTGLLGMFPAVYLRSLYDRSDTLGSKLRETLTDPHIGLNKSDLRALHHYFPDGITGNTAKTHPKIGPIVAEVQDDIMLLSKTLPRESDLTVMRRCSPAEAAGYNQEVRGVIHDACIVALGDEDGPSFAEDLLRSIEPRKYSEGTRTFNRDDVTRSIMRLRSVVNKFGAEAVLRIHKKFDMAAYDLLSFKDIGTLIGLVDDDPAVTEKLRQTDNSLLLLDAYGSDSDVFLGAQQALTTDSKDTSRIVMPWKSAGDFYRMLALLKERGIKFDTLVIGAHGGPGKFRVNKGEDLFVFDTQPLPDGVEHRERKVQQADLYHLSQTALRRVARDYMELPKRINIKRGLMKRIVLIMCSSDVQSNHMPSIAEGVMSSAQDPDLETIASENVTELKWENGNTQRGLQMRGPARGKRYREGRDYPNSNAVLLSIDQGSPWTIVRTPHDERIYV